MEEYIFLAVFHFKMKELNWVSERLGKFTSGQCRVIAAQMSGLSQGLLSLLSQVCPTGLGL